MADDASDQTQLLIVGAGPGGYAAAFRAADLGLSVTIVHDDDRVGGVCLLRGCIPSKALLEIADLLLLAEEAAARGLAFGDPEIDLDRVREWKDEVVDELVDGLEGLMKQRGIEVVQARARFTGSDSVTLDADGDQRRLGFDHAIIATGSSPQPLPGTSFSERVLDSSRALALTDVPDRLLVVGGGYVGLELGSVYAALGSRVTLVEMTDSLLPTADADLVEPLAAHIRDTLDAVHLGVSVSEVRDEDDEVEVDFDGEDAPESASYDRVLIAIGRRPNLDGLGLEDTEVELDDDGFIAVDESRRTADANIYAIGDVVGGYQLAHEAFHEGIVAAEAIAGQPAVFDVRAVPAVVYTDPQLAWCGLTERDAQAQEVEVEVVRFPWKASGRALTLAGDDGLTKLLTEPGTGRILGVGVVGRRAESLITEGVLAIEMGAVIEDLARSVAPHPTLSETLHEAAQVGIGSPLHLPPRQQTDTA